MVVLIHGDYNVNSHGERKPAKMQLDAVFLLRDRAHSAHSHIKMNIVGILTIQFRLTISRSETYLSNILYLHIFITNVGNVNNTITTVCKLHWVYIHNSP